MWHSLINLSLPLLYTSFDDSGGVSLYWCNINLLDSRRDSQFAYLLFQRSINDTRQNPNKKCKVLNHCIRWYSRVLSPLKIISIENIELGYRPIISIYEYHCKYELSYQIFLVRERSRTYHIVSRNANYRQAPRYCERDIFTMSTGSFSIKIVIIFISLDNLFDCNDDYYQLLSIIIY